jgi:hypothetical protein
MELLYNILIDPFAQMVSLPDFFLQVIWEGFVAGILYALIALGFVLIFKASGVFNFAQGIMVVFAALTLVGLHEQGVPAFLALALTIGVMGILAYLIERIVMRPLVGQPDIILLMSTIGLTIFLIGLGEFIFGGEPKQMITTELGLPTGSTAFEIGDGGLLILQHIDVAAAGIAILMVAALGVFFNKTRIGRALRAVADDHQAALSVGISPAHDLGDRLVCRRHRGAGDRHHVGGEIGRVQFSLEPHRAESAAGADPRRLHLDPRRHRRGADHRGRGEMGRDLSRRGDERAVRAERVLVHGARELVRLCACAGFPSRPAARPVRRENNREGLMAHRSRIGVIVIDCQTANLADATAFWTNALGVTGKVDEDGKYAVLADREGYPKLLLQAVDHEPRVHLDIETDDRDAFASSSRNAAASPSMPMSGVTADVLPRSRTVQDVLCG